MAETTPTEIARIDYAVREHRSLWVDAWRQLISSRTAKAGLLIITVLILSTVLAHYFWEYNPKTDLDYTLKLKPPTLIRMKKSHLSTSLEPISWVAIFFAESSTEAGILCGLG